MTSRRLVLLSVAVIGVSLSSCGAAGDLCGRVSPCPNDVPATQAQVTQCRASFSAQQSAPCYSELVALQSCAADNIVCGGNGTTDTALSSTKTTNNCVNQLANARACCTRNPNSTICT